MSVVNNLMYGLQWSVTEGVHGKRPKVNLHQRSNSCGVSHEYTVEPHSLDTQLILTAVSKGQFICPDENPLNNDTANNDNRHFPFSQVINCHISSNPIYRHCFSVNHNIADIVSCSNNDRFLQV